VDEHGHVVVSPDPRLLLQPLPDAGLIPRRNVATDTTIVASRGEELVVSVPANEGRWWVLFRQPGASAYAPRAPPSSKSGSARWRCSPSRSRF